jgi:hypothetical protein
MDDTGIINMWSGPRNVSTALMYSFRQRSDTLVVDEPLYGHYLRVSGADHPAAMEVMQDMDCDGDRVINTLFQQPRQRPRLFLKQMAHHLCDMDHAFLGRSRNLLLIRDPEQMLPSLSRQIPEPTLRDTGLALQWELLQELQSMGQRPLVIDARDLLLDPRGVLNEVCRYLGMEFEESMLSWPVGAKPEDGIWAPHWYHRVHETAGFTPYRHKAAAVAEALKSLLEESSEYYQKLYQFSSHGTADS